MFHETSCVITGGTQGIGRAIAFALGAKGARVALCGRNGERVEQTVGELTSCGITAWGTSCDVSDEASVGDFAAGVFERYGAVEVLVNNAGLAYMAPLLELSTSQIDEMLDVNVRGLMLVTRAFLPTMIAAEHGDIVNIVSLAGKNGFAGGTAYAASKHAVLGFSKSLMLEVRAANIRVITVCPGSVETPFFDKAGVELSNADRVLQPEDVAETVVAALALPGRAMISDLDIRPANP
ncbi:MAG: SDR family NAD(P)-dependent oxidoreductase [Gemmatimonadetes bacterium]|nr:SDR family NAD(P)-dependent oxidoreductase [Gemmatimonadota bacterium]